MKFRALAFIVGTMLMASGCLKTDIKWTIYPDGRGKVSIKGSMNKSLPPIPGMSLPGGQFNWSQITTQSQGFKAFTPVKSEVKNGWEHFEVTGYFEDINDVIMASNFELLQFQMKAEEAGTKLEITTPVNEQLKMFKQQLLANSKNPQRFAMQQAMLGGIIAGLDIRESFKMPGPVTKISGLNKKKERFAGTRIQTKDFQDVKRLKKVPTKYVRVIVHGPPDLKDGELEKFKAEMAAVVQGQKNGAAAK